MKINMSTPDRVIRMLLVLLITVLYFTNVITGTLGIILVAVAVVFLFTSIMGSCPLYSLLGISTCNTKRK